MQLGTEVVFCVDISGSVPAKAFEKILDLLHCSQRVVNGYVVLFNMEIVGKCNLDMVDDLFDAFHASRGGTDFRCLIPHLSGRFGVIITDGMASPATAMMENNFIVLNPMNILDPKKIAICVSLLQDAIGTALQDRTETFGQDQRAVVPGIDGGISLLWTPRVMPHG